MKDDFGDAIDTSRRFVGVPLEQGEVASDSDWNVGGGTGTSTPSVEKSAGEGIGVDRFIMAGDVATSLEQAGLPGQNAPAPAAGEYGAAPAGTGKTLSAEVLAGGLHLADLGLDVLVGGYIGETEKNLARVLDHSDEWNWPDDRLEDREIRRLEENRRPERLARPGQTNSGGPMDDESALFGVRTARDGED